MPVVEDDDLGASPCPKAYRCSLSARNPYLVCAVHPDGVDSDRCLDFRPNPNAQMEEQWTSEGSSWYGDELIPDRPRCGQALSRYSQLEQNQILDNHPFFSGVCPQCRHEFNRDSRIVHYDCHSCGWVDDSV